MQMNWHWPTPNGKPPAVTVLGLALPLLVMLCTASAVGMSPDKLLNAIPRMLHFTQHLWVMPDWAYLPQLGKKMLETVEMSLLATALAVLLSLPLGIFAAKNASPHPWLYRLSRDLLSFIRALPELVWALVFVSALGLGRYPALWRLRW